ncbi:MAG: ATP-binding protein [Bacteroidales bacterium]|nr:ATP-binding protein [Candidatus Physcocola equi]
MEIQRDILDTLKEWKDNADHKPILLKGARQIGKSWVMDKFGEKNFEYVAKFSFDRQIELKTVFKEIKEPIRLLKELALYTNVPIIAGKTLIILDEIQECEDALNSLKFFREDAPEYHIIAAGSLLGVAVKRKHMTVPVGKVRIVRMYPISFREFLRASDRQTFDYIENITVPEKLPLIVLNKLKQEYKRFIVSGGMPEAAAAMIEGNGIGEIENILQDILDLYELDFSKYAESRDVPRIHAIWHSLPSQLAKENRKFIYKVIKEGARSKDYEDALMWLEDAGMIYRVFNISKPGVPIKAYEEPDAFKVYACDCGLLRRLAHLESSAIVDPISNYTEFKGSLAENAVLQSILPHLDGMVPNYWSSNNRAELEFVIQHENEIIPIEVKADNCVNGRSLTVYNDKYKPKNRIRFSSLNLQYNCGLLSCPSALAEWFKKLLPK